MLYWDNFIHCVTVRSAKDVKTYGSIADDRGGGMSTRCTAAPIVRLTF